MGEPYAAQLAEKEQRIHDLLGAWPSIEWIPAFSSPESAFRNKAKLVVGGTAQAPTLGILGPDGHGTDLQHCGLYQPDLAAAFPTLVAFITRANLTPFDVPTGQGELKNILVTVAPSGELMIRFVMRSTESLARIRKHLPWLHDQLPQARVITLNLLPERKAVPEGDTDIVLTDADTLPMRLRPDLTLHLRPQSFFQTNTTVAAALYAQARVWVDDVVANKSAPRTHESTHARILDLYCGVGGFALHCAAPGREVMGVEISAQAIASARLSAAEAGIVAHFEAGDATHTLTDSLGEFDVVIVNPPRRGIGTLATTLNASESTRHVIYSSCNAVTLARDLAAMPAFDPIEARMFDMFPQTDHAETLVLLRRK